MYIRTKTNVAAISLWAGGKTGWVEFLFSYERPVAVKMGGTVYWENISRTSTGHINRWIRESIGEGYSKVELINTSLLELTKNCIGLNEEALKTWKEKADAWRV